MDNTYLKTALIGNVQAVVDEIRIPMNAEEIA